MDRPHRPLLFLDVDGPLIPFGAAPFHESAPRPTNALPAETNPLLTRLNPDLGPLLSSLSCDLVWATTWTHEANRSISPALGLPTLPIVEWPEQPHDPIDRWFGLHWKTRTLIDWAAGRSFIWIDDELSDADREWASTRHPGRALLHHVDPRIGLRRNDFETLLEWLEAPVDS